MRNRAGTWRFGTLLVALLLAAGPLWAIGVKAQQSPAELTAQATIPRSGFFMVYEFDSLWMMSDGRLVRVNAADGALTDIEIPASEAGASLLDINKYRALAVGESAVWVPDMGSSTIYKVDPGANKVVLKIPTDIFGGDGSIGVGAGSVWVVTFDNHNKTLTRYNAATGAVEARIALPRRSKEVVFDHGSVWVTAAGRGELYRIDPASNEVVATISVTDSPSYMASGEGSIWILDLTAGVVQRIDGRTGELAATIDAGAIDSDGGIVAGGGFVWVITRRMTITRIDPASNKVRGNFRAEAGMNIGRRIGYGAGSLWVSGGSIFRLEPPE